ncbi:MAG: hypothetical protein ISS20_22885 [Acidovorax sp.]|nr:hypothetical protein [Acidovorax sp.]
MAGKTTGDNAAKNDLSTQAESEAEIFLYLPIYPVVVTLCIGLPLAVLSLMGFYTYGLAFEPLLFACAFVGGVSAMMLYFSYLAIRSIFSPLGVKGLEFVDNFNFNESGKTVLRSVVEKKIPVREIDLSMALRAHFRQENETKAKVLDNLRKKTMSRFTNGIDEV